MKIKLLVVGKTTDVNLDKLLSEYQNRLKYYIGFDIEIIPEVKNTKKMSESEQKEKEADQILKHLENSDEVFLLDDKGKQFTSMGFSEFLSKKMQLSLKQMVFVVGGPYGFSDRIYQRSAGLLSLSLMTFSHQMVRLIFIEQLYRAFTIIKGEPYHHE